MALLDGKQIRDGSIADVKLANPAGQPTKDNKAMAASTTTADGDVACATAIAHLSRGYVEVQVNGATQVVGDAVKTADCFWSSDNGTTALSDSNVPSGAKLFWNGSIAGFQLAAATDKISFLYNA